MTVNIQHVVCAYETQSFISITYLNLEFLKIFRIFFLVCMFCPFYHGSASLSYWPYCPCQLPWLLWCATYLKMSCVCATVSKYLNVYQLRPNMWVHLLYLNMCAHLSSLCMNLSCVFVYTWVFTNSVSVSSISVCVFYHVCMSVLCTYYIMPS